MIMSGIEFMDDIPFSEVYIHGTVRDDAGRKMSKSLGNSIDPLDIVEKHSADALRFSLIMLTSTGQDVYISDEKFEIGRNFATKIWNAARYMKMQTGDSVVNPHSPDFETNLLSADDRHILAKLNKTIADCEDNLSRYRFNDMAKAMYDFLWHQYCDWYVEYSKLILYGEEPEKKKNVLEVMHFVFSNALRLLHPLMPFLTEELWHGMGYNTTSASIMRAAWPQGMDSDRLTQWGVSKKFETYVDAKHDLIRVARTLRADYNLAPSQKVDFIFRPASERNETWLLADQSSISSLLRAGEITVDSAFEPEKAMPSGLSQLGTVYMPLEGLLDVDTEVSRLNGQLQKVEQELEKATKKLGNINFLGKAPTQVVDHQKRRKMELLEKRDKLKQLIETLSSGQKE